MSEETNVQDHNDGTWSGLKKTIVGVATTAVMGLGTWGVTKMTGGGGDEPAPAPVQQAAPVININNTQQQQQSAGGGTKVIERVVEKPAAKPAEPAPKKKEFTEEPKW
jgi:hypothetical protein